MRRPRHIIRAQLYDQLIAEGWTLTGRGFPDFIAYKPNRLVLIQSTATSTSKLRTAQLKLLKALAKQGVKCYRWSPDAGYQEITP